jgi:hypothetical protein
VKWFTRDWQQGRLTDDESSAVTADYVSHVEKLRRSTPAALRVLSGSTGQFSLHDGWFIYSQWTSGETRDLTIDVAGWYMDQPLLHVRIVYREAELLFPTQEIFDRLRATPSTEILYGEVDLTHDGRFEHRLLLWPEEAGYFAVRFKDLELAVVHFAGGHAEVLTFD